MFAVVDSSGTFRNKGMDSGFNSDFPVMVINTAEADFPGIGGF
jgi:hypothetical protein